MSKQNQIKSLVAVLRANKPLKLLLMAIGLAILAAFLAVKYLQLREAALKQAYQRSGERMVSVVVAKKNLQRGAVLNKSNLAVRKIPSIYVHQQVVPPGKFKVIKGRRLLEPLAKGRALLWSHVAGDQRRDFSDVLTDGRRAVTIPVDQLSSISGMIEPGNHVDLHITLPAKLVGGSGEGDVVFPLLQNVEVLATGRRLEPKVQATMAVAYRNQGRGYNTLTVNLSAKETSLLFAANTAGRLSASLRNRSDNGFVFTSIRPGEILSFAQNLNQEAKAKAQSKVKVVRDKDGNIIGHEVDGKVVNENGDVIGKVNSDGTVVSNSGEIIGTAAEEPVVTEKVVRDKDGNVVGKVVNGQVLNDKGEVIGKVNDDGSVVSNDGKSLGTLSEKIVSKVKVVRDKNGKVIGRVVNGKVVNDKGEVIGKVNESGAVVSNSGQSLGTVSEESVTPELARKLGSRPTSSSTGGSGITPTWLVDYLVGGNSKDGIALVTKVPIK